MLAWHPLKHVFSHVTAMSSQASSAAYYPPYPQTSQFEYDQFGYGYNWHRQNHPPPPAEPAAVSQDQFQAMQAQILELKQLISSTQRSRSRSSSPGRERTRGSGKDRSRSPHVRRRSRDDRSSQSRSLSPRGEEPIYEDIDSDIDDTADTEITMDAIKLARGRFLVEHAARDPNIDLDNKFHVDYLTEKYYSDNAVIALIRRSRQLPVEGREAGGHVSGGNHTSVPPLGRTYSSKASADPDDPEEEEDHRREKLLVRKCLETHLPGLTGSQPAKVDPTKKRAKLDPWLNELDTEPIKKEDILGWPIHHRMKATRQSVFKKLGEHTQVERDAKLSRSRYNRVPDSILPSSGPRHLWYHADDPGWEDKQPRDYLPLKVENTKTPKTFTCDLSDARDILSRNLKISKRVNVELHMNDYFSAVVSKAFPADSADRKSHEDMLRMWRLNLSDLACLTTANVVSHQIYERHMAFDRDTRGEILKLPALVKSKFCMLPSDSSEKVFGAQTEDFAKALADIREDCQLQTRRPIVVDAAGNTKMNFRGKGNLPYRGASRQSGGGRGKPFSSRPQVPHQRKPGDYKARGRGGYRGKNPRPQTPKKN